MTVTRRPRWRPDVRARLAAADLGLVPALLLLAVLAAACAVGLAMTVVPLLVSVLVVLADAWWGFAADGWPRVLLATGLCLAGCAAVWSCRPRRNTRRT